MVVSTKNDYKDLRKKYEELIEHGNKNPQDIEQTLYKLRNLVLLEGLPPQSEEELEYTKSGSNCSLRGWIWKIFLNVKEIDAQRYISLVLKGPSKVYQKISKDLTRTFKHDLSYESVVDQDKLSRVLNSFAHSCPEIGYVQGLNVVAGTLLYVLPEADAFFCFEALVRNHCYQYMVDDLPGVHAALNLLGKILQCVDPELYNHLLKNQYKPAFLMHAILSLGSGTPPLGQVVRLWDVYMGYGIHLNVVCTAAQLVLMRDSLLAHQSPCSLLRVLPRLEADPILSLAIILVRELPDNLYDLLVKHTSVPISIS